MFDTQTLESLAMLDLSEIERLWITKTAEALESDFQALSDIDTTEESPLVTVLDIQNVMREDIWSKTVSREELLSSAPEHYDGYFQVPRTLE